MNIDLEKFVALRKALIQEKAALEGRLAKINAALDAQPAVKAVAPAIKAAPAPKKVAAPRRRQARVKNKLTLKEAVLQVTKVKPLSRTEVLEAVQKLGYKFTTTDPLNSLGVILYNKRVIKNAGGKFSPAK